MRIPLPEPVDPLDEHDANLYLMLRDVDHDDLFRKMGSRAIVINDLPYETKDDRAAVNALTVTTYDNTDLLSAIPSCSCGHLRYGDQFGRTCPKCNTLVQRPAEHQITHNIWLRVPDGVHGFITPAIWISLSKRLSPSDFNLMEWITNPLLQVPDKLSEATKRRIKILEEVGWKRGLNYFIENIDRFIELIPRFNVSRPARLMRRMQSAKATMFPKYLPMPSKILLVIEKTNRGIFTDLPIAGAVDAVKVIVSLSRSDEMSQAKREKLTSAVIKNLGNYYRDTMKVSYRRKKGWYRGQVFGSRSVLSFRSVISAIVGPHRYDELHVPWTIGVEIFKVHIISRLINHYNYGWREAYTLVETSGRKYNPRLAEIMAWLISNGSGNKACLGEVAARFPTMGLDALFQRNPTLARTSSQNLPITKVKDDPNDPTISLSPLICNGPNADFDGDGMNGQLAPDQRLGKFFKLASPHYGIHSLQTPGRLNNCTGLTETAVSTISNYFNEKVIARAIAQKHGG